VLRQEFEVRPYHSVFPSERIVFPDIKTSDSTPVKELPTHVTQEPIPEIEPEPQYSTQWRGGATLEEILTDKNVQNVAYAKMRSLGYTDQDAEDCFQLGSLNLWKALKEQPMLLCDKRAAWVGIWIAFSGSRRALWKHKARNIPLDGAYHYSGNRPERWAGFATRVDEQIDFALLMNALAQRYDGDPQKLFALYSLTTSVKMKDVLPVAKAHKNQLIEARNEVKNEMREILEKDEGKGFSDEFWTDNIKRGENLECVTRIAERVMNNQRLLLALYIVTTSAKRKDVAELFSIPLTKFRQEIAQIKMMLAEEFRKAQRR